LEGIAMRRILLLSSILLSSTLWAVAQTGNVQGDAGSAHTSKMTVVGCLDGAIGKYTLTNEAGATYQLTGNTDPLRLHVGETIRVTGIITPIVNIPGSMSEGTRTQPSLSVDSFQRISQVCGDGNIP
jgi:hypothetical protein